MQLCASCFTRCAWLLGPAASMIWDLSVLHLPLLVCSFAYVPLLATKAVLPTRDLPSQEIMTSMSTLSSRQDSQQHSFGAAAAYSSLVSVGQPAGSIQDIRQPSTSTMVCLDCQLPACRERRAGLLPERELHQQHRQHPGRRRVPLCCHWKYD